MRVRVFTNGPFPIDKGALDLDALPRSGDVLLARDPGGPAYYAVRRVLHVEGALPILFVALTEGEEYVGLDLAITGLAEVGALRPLGGYDPYDDPPTILDLDVPQLGL